jgi:hypothetical protein
MGGTWTLIRHMKASPQFKVSIRFALILCILSVVFGVVFGYLISNHFFHKNIEYLEYMELKELNDLRPNVDVETYDQGYFAAVIRTGDNKEIIDRLIITLVVNGIVTKKYPRSNIINGEPCDIENRSFFSISGKKVYDKVTIKCYSVLPSTLNGVVVEYKKSDVSADFDDRVSVEWYWKYKGQTKKEERLQERKSLQ